MSIKAKTSDENFIESKSDNMASSNNLPLSPLEMVEQSTRCIIEALEAGRLRQQVDLLLPVNEKERRFTATEPDDVRRQKSCL